jgi:transmembrane sensor
VNESDIDWRLITAHLADEATPTQETALRCWLAADPERERWLSELREIWDATTAPAPARDVKAAWARVRVRTLEPAPMDTRPERRLRLPLRGGRPGPLASVAMLRIAAMLLLVLLPVLYWTLPGEMFRGQAPVTAQAPRGGTLEVALPDGSRVVLGPESSLRYPSRLGRSGRDVYLQGMGYFEVAPDLQRPFTVHARGSATRVLGTAFAVRAYPEDPQVRVAVTHGSVALNAEGRPDHLALTLTPGEVGRFLPDGSLEASAPGSLDDEVGWMQGRLTLRDQPLRDALVRVGRWYDMELVVDDTVLAARRITTTLDRQEPLTHVLSLIALSVDAHHTLRGDAIVFHPNPR